MTRKPSNSSFFSVLCPELKNRFFWKIHWAPSEILEAKRPFLRSQRPNYGFHLLLIGFHLEFSLFWVSRSFDISNLGDLRRGSKNTFLKSVPSNKKDEVYHSFLVEIFTKSLHRGGVLKDPTFNNRKQPLYITRLVLAWFCADVYNIG